MKALKVLLLVAEPWRMDDGGGNTINNLFEGMDVETAQIYCSDLLPENKVCKTYFQFTEQSVIKNFLLHKKIGKTLEWNARKKTSLDTQTTGLSVNSHCLLSVIKKKRWNCFLTAKNILWRYSNWKTEELEGFIKKFDPDVIYAPCYASPFMLALSRYVKQLTGKKIVTWSADDNYSLKQFSLSPFFWINRLWNRCCLRKTYPYYDSFYSISEDEIAEMEPIVGQKMKILRKGIHVDEISASKETVNQPIRLIYAGGIYIQRWKTLKKIGDALRKINADGIKMRLDIYTQNELTKQQFEALNDGVNIVTHPAVDQKNLKKLYRESDIALHCESFSRKDRLTTRLSFSTKIIDCLASGCAVMAIAWKDQTGLKYLRSQDAAICITDLREIETALRKITENPEVVLSYADKARKCGVMNHNIDVIQKELYQEFVRLSK